jgi:nicotinate-nucleotide pyrophosphorylase (carboxylating)
MDRLDTLLRMAIEEDLGHRDVTTEALIHPGMMGEALVLGREPFVLSGSQPFRKVFELIDPGIHIESHFQDGERIQTGIPAFQLAGRVRAILTGERTALNFLQRLSGIASITRQMVDALSQTSCRLLDTRKTTPLWRLLEKEAVRHGGGFNHRFGLSDGILIKDNHIAASGGVRKAIDRARMGAPHTLKIEIEVENLDDLEEAINAGADIILLDNFSMDALNQAVRHNDGRCLLEASGGITLENVRSVAETGVDFVSSGAITHSARAIDLTMELSVPDDGMYTR